MHIPAHHAELHIPTLCRFIRSNPLGILTTAIKSPDHSTIQSSHIPWVTDIKEPSSETTLPVLRGHIARANPQSRSIIHETQQNPCPWPSTTSTTHKLQDEVMILFNGPVHHYVTPKFYVGTKPATGKVVPTWNYSAVQIYGKATVYTDSKAEETLSFLAKQLNDLSRNSETEIMNHAEPWEVAEAPVKYVELLTKNIIGIEIEVTKMEGRIKMSQDKPIEDREGVVAGFKALGTEQGGLMADAVQERSDMREAERAKRLEKAV